MNINYIKNINRNLIFLESIEDKEKRHECYDLIIHKDITRIDTKKSLHNVKNKSFYR
ncbi:hypothetical protein [Maledivibacter halophilus]|uniref:Uncharacterized protein n=1 Tax=Maledivibacter halophilus TaxID=36842 RepID=A0A1T5MTX0_9FIRM|nr:hypothetical protein [Maledivibacter halophilus]SKC91484.1 hypothetical protein SAMN02194393_05325 [Maledivibacter halophilus]